MSAVVTAAADVRTFPEVASVRYLSPQDALARARRELGEFSDVFDAAVLPPSIEVSLRPGNRDPATVKAVAARVAAATGADDVRYGEEWVQKLYRLRTLATAAGIALGIAFATVAVIIIGATIRMAVLSRSPEIQIMRLVGATDSFVRLPFLIEGLFKGVLGGVLALVLLWTAHAVVDRYFVRTSFFEAPIAIAGVTAGALLGLVGSAVSVGRHLRLVGRDRRRNTRV
jgi:cell division transport system permease protein